MNTALELIDHAIRHPEKWCIHENCSVETYREVLTLIRTRQLHVDLVYNKISKLIKLNYLEV